MKKSLTHFEMLKVNFSKDALSTIQKLSKSDKNTILSKIDILSKDLHAFPSRELQGYKPLRRIRSGFFRIIYYIEDNILHIAFI